MRGIKTKICLAVIILLGGFFRAGIIQATDTSVQAFLNAGAMNNIVSDNDFTDVNSMSAADIQNFLVQKNSYLKDYSENGLSAATILYQTAKALLPAAQGSAKGITIDSLTGTINPKILLVYIQKEQSLVTTTTFNDYGIKYAMGYGCPDGCGCACAAHQGFTEQVGWGAWQLRYNFEIAKKDATWWNTNYPGNSPTYFYVGLNKTISDYTGDYNVTIQNAATASIYRYTPHVFDSAYNVWYLFNSWFTGTPPPPVRNGNDTANIDAKTYITTYSYTGAKSTESKAFVNGTLNADLGTTTWAISGNADVGATTFVIEYRDVANVLLSSKTIINRRYKMADINGDGVIDISDLAIFAQNWNKTSPGEPMSDFNGDNVVDITDLAIFADSWGK